jgi:hypothetical protein
MRALPSLAIAAALVVLPTLGHAYSCPILIKEAEDQIVRAEAALAKATGGDRAAADAALAEAKRMVAEARKEHEGAKAKPGHAAAVRKAKIARAYAEEAQALAER